MSLRPPANVWRLLQRCEGNKIWINLEDRLLYLLQLLKAMYGVGDGPLAFGLCSAEFYCNDLGANQSNFDENFYFWLETSCWPQA